MVRRAQICLRDLPRESWTTVHLPMMPAAALIYGSNGLMSAAS
jgi:hypothetical protein